VHLEGTLPSGIFPLKSLRGVGGAFFKSRMLAPMRISLFPVIRAGITGKQICFSTASVCLCQLTASEQGILKVSAHPRAFRKNKCPLAPQWMGAYFENGLLRWAFL